MAGLFGIEPERPGLGLAHLRSIAFRKQRAGHTVKLHGVQATCQIDSGRDVAPLIATANLDFTTVILVEIGEVVCLNKHIAKLGVAQTGCLLVRDDS